jgi:hypothetical protein
MRGNALPVKSESRISLRSSGPRLLEKGAAAGLWRSILVAQNLVWRISWIEVAYRRAQSACV